MRDAFSERCFQEETLLGELIEKLNDFNGESCQRSLIGKFDRKTNRKIEKINREN